VSIYQTIWCNNPEDHNMKYILNHDMCSTLANIFEHRVAETDGSGSDL
jgi:hypothetical protein